MESWLKLVPLILLVVFAVVVVWRGMRRKPDNTANKARGGGSASHYQGGHGPPN